MLDWNYSRPGTFGRVHETSCGKYRVHELTSGGYGAWPTGKPGEAKAFKTLVDAMHYCEMLEAIGAE